MIRFKILLGKITKVYQRKYEDLFNDQFQPVAKPDDDQQLYCSLIFRKDSKKPLSYYTVFLFLLSTGLTTLLQEILMASVTSNKQTYAKFTSEDELSEIVNERTKDTENLKLTIGYIKGKKITKTCYISTRGAERSIKDGKAVG